MKKRRIGLVTLTVLVALTAAFLIYTGQYYPASPEALAALQSDGKVSVTRTGYGWWFDGPSDTDALIFYPGAKIEETAYAPLMHLLAREGMDVCLVKMPFRLALFGVNRAGDVMAAHDYAHWYVGGHSLGGAMAASYAAGHAADLTGVVLLAAYPTRALDDRLTLISVYGSEDGILNRAKLDEGDRFAPNDYLKCKIAGGNHAGFGNYGAQKGDGTASISAAVQQRQTVAWIQSAQWFMRRETVSKSASHDVGTP